MKPKHWLQKKTRTSSSQKSLRSTLSTPNKSRKSSIFSSQVRQSANMLASTLLTPILIEICQKLARAGYISDPYNPSPIGRSPISERRLSNSGGGHHWDSFDVSRYSSLQQYSLWCIEDFSTRRKEVLPFVISPEKGTLSSRDRRLNERLISSEGVWIKEV